MSVVAAKVYKDKIVMASDSIIVRGWSKNTNNDFSKLVEINGMLMGGVGVAEESSLMWQFMKTHKPESPNEKDILEFVIEFAKWKRDITGNYAINNDYLLAYDGHLFVISSMLAYEVTEYCAIGAGEDFANAAMHLGHTPREAVKVSCDLCCYVAEPILEFEQKK